MRKRYSSDITREQFEEIKYTLEKASKKTAPQKKDLYDIFCAILYRTREGCRWRSIPHDFPNWKICYYHYNKWRTPNEFGESTLDVVLKDIVTTERITKGKVSSKTSMIIVDSKSVKNTFTANYSGYDAGKKQKE